MRGIDYLNEWIQGLIIILLIVNAIKIQSLTLFQLAVTLLGVLFGFYIKYVYKEG